MSQRQRRTRAKARRHARSGAIAASAAIGLASPQAADALKAAKGPKTGKLKVPTEITFTPTGGAPNAEDHAYKLKLK